MESNQLIIAFPQKTTSILDTLKKLQPKKLNSIEELLQKLKKQLIEYKLKISVLAKKLKNKIVKAN